VTRKIIPIKLDLKFNQQLKVFQQFNQQLKGYFFNFRKQYLVKFCGGLPKLGLSHLSLVKTRKTEAGCSNQCSEVYLGWVM